MFFKTIIKYFEDGNVCVTGLRGRGKDMLMANVVCRRKQKYISNVTYDTENHIEFIPEKFNVSHNNYKNFISGEINKYIYPYDDGIDLYISDIGVYYPSQYCNELNKQYPYIPTFMCLSRQIGECNVHFNVQNLNRAWDKFRELSDLYISCQYCKVLFGKYVLQKVIVYDKYESCVSRVKPYAVSLPIFAHDEARVQYDIDKSRYEQTYGMVKGGWLFYRNKSNYDTRIFKKKLEHTVD